jgi:pimeloyl-ACP methyl ester carboxylesterase
MSRARMMFDRQLAGPMRALAVMAIVITAGCAERVEKRPITPAQQQLLSAISRAGASDMKANGRTDGGMSLWGKLDGRAFDLAIPAGWNHQALLFANGYSIPGTPVAVPPDPIAKDPSGGVMTAAYREGFAVGQSTYDKSAMAVKSGVTNTLRLRQMLARLGTERFYISGASMGGNIVMALIEKHPDAFAGAMSGCGVTGGWDSEVGALIDLRALYNYFTQGTDYELPGNHDIAANALSPTPPRALGFARQPWLLWQMKKMSGPITSLFKAADKNPDGPEATIIARIASAAGTDRDPAQFLFPILTAMVGMDDMRATFGGNAFSNRDTVYYSDLLTPAENTALNRDIQRIDADPAAAAAADDWYRSTGHFKTPLVAVHNPKDGLVFATQARLLRHRVLDAGNEARFFQLWAPSVKNDIPGTGLKGWAHCGFNPRQARVLWGLLRGWVESGKKPELGKY